MKQVIQFYEMLVIEISKKMDVSFTIARNVIQVNINEIERMYMLNATPEQIAQHF